MTERMNPEAKKLWLAALRSGDYPQTRGKLHRLQAQGDRPPGWCCYGALCDVAAKAGVPVARRFGTFTEVFDGDRDFPPASVTEWAGLPGENVFIRHVSLADRNDNGMSFREIADLIEVEL